MRYLLLALILATCVAAPARAEPCTPVEGDRILAGDLARVLPVFAVLDPEEPVAYTPVPGAQRVMSPAQLRQLMQRYDLPGAPATAVCFERFAEPLTAERVEAALRTALDAPEAKLEVADFSRHLVPRGELEFRSSGLASASNSSAESPVLWRGLLRYGNRRSVSVWARVRISVTRPQVTALRDLPPGEPIRSGDVTEEMVAGFPFADPPLDSIEQAIGSLPRRTIKAGQPLYASFLKLPNAVERGEVVSVEVISGGARLRFEARAETSGRRGDPVYLRHPTSGKRFTALIDGKGKAVIQAGSSRKRL